MTVFAIVALIGVDSDGNTQEMSRECEDMEEVTRHIIGLDKATSWRAITILHIEDFPYFMDNSKLVGGMTWNDE